MFQTGAATNLNDVFAQLATFITAQGWIEDEDETNGFPSYHRGNVYVQFRYNPTSSGALGRHLGVYQSLGYTPGNNPGSHPQDSGNGAFSSSATIAETTLDNERHVSNVGDGPFNYWFFEDEIYVHVVLEVRPGEFRHFGFGEIQKFGSWTGGEYAYGHTHEFDTAAELSTSAICAMLDGIYNSATGTEELRAATMRLVGLPDQDPATVWANVWGGISGQGLDQAGNVRANVSGGFRGGFAARALGSYSPGATGQSSIGVLPMYPINCWYLDTANTRARYIGSMPDVRGMNIASFAPGDEVTVSADTWVVFPLSIKQIGGDRSTGNLGIAYKKVTT